jgi:hypothetical protein
MAAIKPVPDKPLHKHPKSTQKSIQFNRALPEGIFEIKPRTWFDHRGVYSVTFPFTDINYAVASEDDKDHMFYVYEDILNSIDHNTLAKITIINHRVSDDQLEADICMLEKGDQFDSYRKEMNRVNIDRVKIGFNSIVRQKMLTVTCKKRYEEARLWFNRIEGNLKGYFDNIGSDCNRMSTFDRLKMIHDFYRPEEAAYFQIDLEDIAQKGHKVQDSIAPDGMRFYDNYFMIGNRYGRVLYLRDYPSSLEDKLITKLTDVPISMILSIDLISKTPDEALRIIKRLLTEVEAEIARYTNKVAKDGNFNAKIPPALQDKRDNLENLRKDIKVRDQRLILSDLTVLHMADSLQELNTDTENLMSIARSELCQFGNCMFQQEAALSTCLPLGVRMIDALRTLTTESAAIMIPFTAQEVWDEGGIVYGINEITKNIIKANRRLLPNGNGLIFGVPGGGKSMLAKLEIIWLLLNTKDEILCVDPENEFAMLANIFFGQRIDVKAGSKHHMNALDMNYHFDADDNPFEVKSELMMSLIELMMDGKKERGERSIIDRCLSGLFRQNRSNKALTMTDLYETLITQDEPLAKKIALDMELFTKGSLNAFAQPTNVDINNRFTVFNINELGEQFKSMAMMIVLDHIMSRITYNKTRGVNTWLYFDELHVMYKFERTSKAMDEQWRRCRKYGGFATGMTQNVSALLESEHARTMISNSEFIMMLNQAKEDRDILANLLDLSPNQLAHVTNSKPGHGLMRRSAVIVPFDATFDAETELYKAITTKFDDYKKALEAKR